MSRKLSIEAKKGGVSKAPRVHFPDALIFLDSIKENDLKVCSNMLNKASRSIDLNKLNESGIAPLHQAVLDGNFQAVKLLIQHGADVNKKDTDTWTPLHAACAEGQADIVRYLLHKGAKKDQRTDAGERPLDLIDAADLYTIAAILESDSARAARLHEAGSSHNSANSSKGSGSRHSSSCPSSPSPSRSPTAGKSRSPVPAKPKAKPPPRETDSDSSSSDSDSD